MLVATHELESFAIKYGKTHLTANESAVIVQKLFGEFYALFDESGFFFFARKYLAEKISTLKRNIFHGL